MSYFFDVKKQAFFHSDVNFEIPDSAIDISDGTHQRLLDAINHGNVITYTQGEWEITAQKYDEQAVISAEKSAKLAEINAKAQAFVNQLAHLDETPEFERETWPIQREEAKAWFADRNAETPTIALIAQMRGVPLDVLRQKAFEKAMAYQTVAAVVAGQRQAYEDRLNRAETLEQIQAIEPVYQLPMNEEVEDVQNDES